MGKRRPTIVAMGGGFMQDGRSALARYIVELTGNRRPRVCVVPTASGDVDSTVLGLYGAYSPLTTAISCLRFFARTPRDLRSLVLKQDIVHVGGGNTKSMLAVWREYGFDGVLAEAYESGIVLCGSSAGSICWFEEGVTDSFSEVLTPLTCLGLLKGSNCPHYDSEADRRPAYQRLVREKKIAGGVAADDGVGLHFVDGRLKQIVTARPKAKAYRVELAGKRVEETALPAVLLPDPFM
ncbi:MAG: Type 1 glutamine amidotransferase-like domain-containing protein [Vulcanimicrobiaceae bacterium]